MSNTPKYWTLQGMQNTRYFYGRLAESASIIMAARISWRWC